MPRTLISFAEFHHTGRQIAILQNYRMADITGRMAFGESVDMKLNGTILAFGVCAKLARKLSFMLHFKRIICAPVHESKAAARLVEDKRKFIEYRCHL